MNKYSELVAAAQQSILAANNAENVGLIEERDVLINQAVKQLQGAINNKLTVHAYKSLTDDAKIL